MIEPITLARPYARAAFNFARGINQLSGWQDALIQLASISTHADVSVLLRDPGRTPQQRSQSLLDLLGREGLPEGLGNLLEIMSDNGRLGLLPEVSGLFSLLKQEEESAVTVEVTSAYPLSEAEVGQLTEAMTAKLGRSITLNAHTNPSLLGGAIIRADDLVIDGSVRGRLNKLAGTLNQ